MFKTKRDVDRHVSHILNRIRDEKEVTILEGSFLRTFFSLWCDSPFCDRKAKVQERSVDFIQIKCLVRVKRNGLQKCLTHAIWTLIQITGCKGRSEVNFCMGQVPPTGSNPRIYLIVDSRYETVFVWKIIVAKKMLK